jgi:methylated-DNA-protein-cysteine methyltransferase related protein
MELPPDPMSYYKIVWEIVRQVPSGIVTTYGQIASMIPAPESVNPPDYEKIAPRWVGYAMNAVSSADLDTKTTPDGKTPIPWQRVINSKGGISLPKGSHSAHEQRIRLEGEGVQFDENELVDLNMYGWDGPDDAWLRARKLYTPRSIKKAPKKSKDKGESDESGGQMKLL